MKSRQRRSFSAEMKARIALEAIKGQKTIQEIAKKIFVVYKPTK
jgi:transposase-like protein